MRRGAMNEQRSVTKRWVRGLGKVVSWRTLQQEGRNMNHRWFAPLQQDQTCKSLSQGGINTNFPSDLFWNIPISVISPLFMKYRPVFTKPLSSSFHWIISIPWDYKGHSKQGVCLFGIAVQELSVQEIRDREVRDPAGGQVHHHPQHITLSTNHA